MPLIDLPLEELKAYQGRNPKPADFDAYWERGLAEMRAVDPQLDLVPSKFQTPTAECFDLYFTGVGGARVHAKYARPKHATQPHPAIVQFHGYYGKVGDWFDLLTYVSLGFSIAVLDCRGQTGTSEDPGGVQGTTLNGHIIRGLHDPNPDKLAFRQIFLDTAQLAGIVMNMPEVDAGRVGATGGSQGGALTIACAALEPRIKRLAPVYPFLSDYKRSWEMDFKEACAEIRTYFCVYDPRHERENEIFTKLGYIDIQHLADRIQGETLWGVGLMDTICPPSTQFATYNKIKSPKQTVVYPDFGHERLPDLNDFIVKFMLGL